MLCRCRRRSTRSTRSKLGVVVHVRDLSHISRFGLNNFAEMWLAVVACVLVAAGACRQNEGRACTVDELTYPIIEVTPGPIAFPNTTRLLALTEMHAKLKSRQWKYYNPSLLVFDRSLWAFMRIEASGDWNDTFDWCPGGALTDVEPCIRAPEVGVT